VAKLPLPDLRRLRSLEPEVADFAEGMRFARVYLAAGDHPVAWNSFRHWGPNEGSRFDHHLPNDEGQPQIGERGVLYLAKEAITCLAEVFQHDRIIDRNSDDPYLVIFTLERPIRLLDLTGEFATRMGASGAISTGPRDRSRNWARALYDAFPGFDGLLYQSSMRSKHEAVVLFETAESAIPEMPDFNRALSDHSLTNTIDACCAKLGYLKG
jgi:hypothetical protein